MEEKEKVFCPVNGWDCPYWRKDGQCGMIEDEGCHPREECDDYAMKGTIIYILCYISQNKNLKNIIESYNYTYFFNSDILSYISCADISINLFIFGVPIITT